MNDNIIILGFKNKYGTTIKQLKINNEKMTFQVGQFKTANDFILTKKAFYERIELLKKLNYKEL